MWGRTWCYVFSYLVLSSWETYILAVVLLAVRGCLDSGSGFPQRPVLSRYSPPRKWAGAGHKSWFSFLSFCDLVAQISWLLFCLFFVKIYPPPELPRDYRPVHYFRPVVAATSKNAHLLQVLSESSGKAGQDMGTHSRHQLNASKRGELLGEMPVQGTCGGGDWACCV